MIAHTLHALLSNDYALNPAVVHTAAEALRVSSAHGARAWGFGTIQDGRPIVKRRPALRNHIFDFATMAGDAPSRVLIGAVVGETPSPLQTNGIPPFRYGGWLAANYPMLGRVLSSEQRGQVQALIPAHLLRTLEGDSDGELLAHAMLANVVTDPASANVDFPLERLRAHVSSAFTSLQRLSLDVPLDTIISNGRVLVSVADRRPLFWQALDGLADDPIEAARRRDMHLTPRITPRPHFRALLLTSQPGLPGEWNVVSPGVGLTYATAQGAEVWNA